MKIIEIMIIGRSSFSEEEVRGRVVKIDVEGMCLDDAPSCEEVHNDLNDVIAETMYDVMTPEQQEAEVEK